MSLVKFLPAWFHAIADYAVGILLIVVALAVDGSDGAKAHGCGRRRGGAPGEHGSPRYPLGIVKVLPFTIHSAGDYLAAALLIVAPFALNFARRRRWHRGVLRGHGHRGARGEPGHQLPVQPEAPGERTDPHRHRVTPNSSFPRDERPVPPAARRVTRHQLASTTVLIRRSADAGSR